MDALFIIFVAWVLFVLLFEQIGQPLLELLVMLIGFIGLILLTPIYYGGYYGGIGLLWIATRTGRFLWRVISAPFRSRALGEWQEPKPAPRTYTPYEAACLLLHLRPGGFEREEFKTAYRATMRRVHPDLGGSVEAAQIANRAHEIICAVHGWR